jgi:hypothetical protein
MARHPRTIAALTSRLVELERSISLLQLEQAVVVNELDKAQAPLVDGSRTINEYVQARADVSLGTARDLVIAGTTLGHHRSLCHELAGGRITFDRAVATLGLIASGATEAEVSTSRDLDLPDVRRQAASHRRMTRRDERTIHAGRYFTAQPSLDNSRYRLWGELPGYEGRLVDKAVVERAEESRRANVPLELTRGRRQADALVAMAQDSLDRTHDDDTVAGGSGAVTVFVDARLDESVEAAAEVEYGPRVGPDTLETMLCTGSVRVVGMDGGLPVTTSPASRAIPPSIRAAVARRDGGCTIDGCRSRYRLQPHHVVAWSSGGSHHPDNLATLCWYHHHVAIHRSGYSIDPKSPPRRRRLQRPGRFSGHDPP